MFSLRVLAVAVVIVAAASYGALSIAVETTEVQFEPRAGSHIHGMARFTARGEAVNLTLELSGLTPTATYTAHLHAGTTEMPSASTAHLGTLEADASGRGRLETATARVGAAGAAVDLSRDFVFDGDHFLDLHDPTADVVAAAGIPQRR